MILLAAIALRFITVLPVSEDYAYRTMYELLVEGAWMWGLIIYGWPNGIRERLARRRS